MSNRPMPTWNFALVAAICWLLGIAVFAFGRQVQAESAAFMSVARPAKGKFVGFVPWQVKEPGLSSRVYERPMPQLEFGTESGQRVRFVVVSKGNQIFTDLSAAPEREYPVLYDPNNPSHAQLDAGLEKVFWVFYTAALLMAIPAGVFTILWLRRLSASG
jgi:hypothetical protein